MQCIWKIIYLVCCLAILSGCAAGRTAFDKAEKLEQEGRFDEAYLKYAEVSTANPDNQEYRLRYLKIGQEAARVHLKKAADLMTAKNYDGALREYEAASVLDPSLDRAKQQIERVRNLRDSIVLYKEGADFEKSHKLAEAYRSYRKALSINPDNKEAVEAIKRLLSKQKTKIDGFELNLKSNKPITLKFRDTRIKDIFNIITRLSGINFVFDEGVKDQNFSIFLENATFEQALDIITNMNKLGRKVLNESTIIIYPKTPEKEKQYEELVVKTFFLNNLDAKKAINLLRTMLQLKKVYVNEDLNAIVVRDVPETVDVAQKILEANDLPDSEVILDVEVIELTKSNEDKFGLALSQYAVSAAAGKNGVLLTDSLSQATTTSTTGTTTTTSNADVANLLNLFTWRGFGGFFTVPNATYNFGKTLSNAEVLANPKIRIKNREKAKFTVATREPITTISTTSGVTGYSTNIQYVDVGIKMNAEPTILLDSEVNMKLSLEVSSVLSQKTDSVGNTLITIGTRNLDTVLTLKDGETSIIGGLIQGNKSKTKQKIFILGDIPLIGPLISGSDNKKDKTELVLAITPRVVRLPSVPEQNMSTFWSGKEDEPSTTSPYASFNPEPTLTSDQSAAQGNNSGRMIPHEIVAPQTTPQPAPQIAPVPPLQPAPSAQGEAQGSITINAPPTATLDSRFPVEVKTAGALNLYSAPFTLTYDPRLVEMSGVTEGGFMKQDGKQTAFRTSVDRNSGKISVSLNRVGNVGGISGAGTLATILFQAKSKGIATFGIQDAKFATPEGNPVSISPYNVAVEIR
jgi:general secretion pathway protein D